jgi:hypothetical protein
MKRGRLVELHSEAVVFGKSVRNPTYGHLDTPLLNPDLLVNGYVAGSRFVGDSCAGRQFDLHNLDR